ncbi:hypothetical protein LJR267_010723 [Paraburkholderia hospita]|uniref:hypothetical protein n=1 Tax=Paraburkholderia hospita TaxID=169430 RepID=UPI003ECC957B
MQTTRKCAKSANTPNEKLEARKAIFKEKIEEAKAGINGFIEPHAAVSGEAGAIIRALLVFGIE